LEVVLADMLLALPPNTEQCGVDRASKDEFQTVVEVATYLSSMRDDHQGMCLGARVIACKRVHVSEFSSADSLVAIFPLYSQFSGGSHTFAIGWLPPDT